MSAIDVPEPGWWHSLVRSILRLFSADETENRPALPAPSTHTLPALRPPPGRRESSLPSEHVRICIDFGTSNSAIARAVLGGQPELATLQADVRQHRKFNTVDSDILWKIGSPATLGAIARLMDRRRSDDREIYRSLKRMLSDLRRKEDSHLRLRFRVEALIEELLLLALQPASAGTVAAQADLQGSSIEDIAKNLGVPGLTVLTPAVIHGTLDLYLCVPNAFGTFEEEILRSAAQHAGESVQRRISDDPHRTTTVVVHLIREAEAAAWWALHERHLRHRSAQPLVSRWLVFDVGAGSTDAAIVSVNADGDPGHSPEVRSLLHAGVAFGGHDLDELFLRLLAERAGDLPQLDKKLVDSSSSRAIELRALADAKEQWSNDVAQMLARWPAERREEWLSWIAQPQGAMPGVDELPAFRPASDIWPEIKEISGAHWGEPYARFLRGTTIGVLRALVAQSPQATVDQVMLSGRGSLLPGLGAMVARELLRLGWIQNADQVQPIADPGEPLKLACVLGIAVAASHSAIPQRLPQRLTDDISLGRHTPLWARGTRFDSSVLNATIRLDAHSGPRRLGFYQFRCPKEVAEAIGSATLWEHRHLGSVELHVYTVMDLMAQYHTQTGALSLFRFDQNQECFPLTLENDPIVDIGQNPISGLPFGWIDT